MRKLLCTLFLGLFLAACLGVSPARAADTDAETRFHEAYLAEVVDGKVAESAKTYLALMNDENAPKRIRMESQFRFAVCATLLGRADEARSQFDALLAGDATDTLKARAREYRKSIHDVGTGSEYARKLESLVFELARVSHRHPKATLTAHYRQFQVIGDAAIPFVRKLLGHRDASLRAHAFRILLRMNEPGMIQKIPAGTDLLGVWELKAYVASRPDQRAALESLAMKDPKRVAHAQWLASPSFLTSYAKVDGTTRHALRLAGETPMTKERLAVLETWARDSKGDLQDRALTQLLERNPDKASEDLFLPALDHLLTTIRPHVVAGRGFHDRLQPIWTWADRLTTSQLLDAMNLLLEHAQLEWRSRSATHPNQHVKAVTVILQQRSLSEPEAARYVQIFRTWAEKLPRDDWLKRQSPLCRKVVDALPLEEAKAFVTALFSLPVSNNYAKMFDQSKTARDVDLILTASVVTEPTRRWWLVRHLPIMRGLVTDGPLAAKQLAAIWDAVTHQNNGEPRSAVVNLVKFAKKQTDAARRVLEIAKGTNGLLPKTRREAQYALIYGTRTSLAYVARWGLPLLASTDIDWKDTMHGEAASWIVSKLADESQVVSHEERTRLKAFVLKYADRLSSSAVSAAAARGGDIVPYAKWIQRLHYEALNQYARYWRSADRDAIAEELLKNDSDGMNAMMFALRFSEHPTVFADRLLASEDAKARKQALAITTTNGKPASVTALEATLQRALAETPVPLDIVRSLTSKLVKRDPSERLIPAVRVLLQSGDITHVQPAIGLASDLGSEALLPDLQKLLFSMHKPLRANAKKTIDDLNSLVNLRGLPPKKDNK